MSSIVEQLKSRFAAKLHSRSMDAMSVFVSVQGRGTVALPAALRKQYHLDEPGAQVEITERDGYILLRPMLPVPAEQAWYFTEQNLAGERQADAEQAAGLGERSDSDEEFLGSFGR
jgi:bifunctional DNA-binding transcriptional regulator/antitoxin component of YhaV-PrlF toxin-antitoxin module